MTKKPIGPVLKSLANDKNLSIIQIASLVGRTRQQVHHDYKGYEVKPDVLESYAKAFGFTKEELSKMQEETETETVNSNYLMEHLANLEEQFKRLLNQLEIKDKQIEVKDQQMAGLQKTVDVLLGKSEDVMQLMATRVIPMYALEAERA